MWIDKMKKNKFVKITIVVLLLIALVIICLMLLVVAKKQYRIAKDNLRREETATIPSIVCIGDSLTQGTNGSYTWYLEEAMNRDGYYIPVFNLGIGGENSRTIAGRLGGVPFEVKAFEIPKDDQSVPIEFIDDEIHRVKLFGEEAKDMVNPAIIGGVAGEITLDNDTNTYYFTRIFYDEDLNTSQKQNIDTYDVVDENGISRAEMEAASGIYTVETNGQAEYCDGIYIIFMGENGGFINNEELINQQKAILARQTLNKDKFLILSMTTGDTESRQELEEELVSEYGDRYLNLRAYFSGEDIDGKNVFNEAKQFGVTFTETDKSQMAIGAVPGCLRDDDIHYNNAGYRLMADIIYGRMKKLGYFDGVNDLASRYNKIWGIPNRLEVRINKKR